MCTMIHFFRTTINYLVQIQDDTIMCEEQKQNLILYLHKVKNKIQNSKIIFKKFIMLILFSY